MFGYARLFVLFIFMYDKLQLYVHNIAVRNIYQTHIEGKSCFEHKLLFLFKMYLLLKANFFINKRFDFGL